jgi:hypothetical protein
MEVDWQNLMVQFHQRTLDPIGPKNRRLIGQNYGDSQDLRCKLPYQMSLLKRNPNGSLSERSWW